MSTVQSYSWVPNHGQLVITMAPNAIGSLYLDRVDIDIAFSANPVPPNGNPFYTASPPSGNSNPQVVPMPLGTTQVTLVGASASTYYIIASSGIYRPSAEGPSSL